MSEIKEIKDLTNNEPNVSIIVLMNEYPEFIQLFKEIYNSIDYPQDKLEWIVIDDSTKSNIDQFPLEENLLYFHMDDPKDYLEKITFKDEPKKSNNPMDQVDKPEMKREDMNTRNYFLKTNTLPNGFKRDYGTGLSSHDYILHLDIDCYYNPKVLKRKLKFLTKSKLDCIFCDSMLCGFNDKIYKIENNLRAFEGTLFHTRDFWKRKGFKWEDIYNEGDFFHYDNGNDRKMENYYDCIKLIGAHNINDYNYKEVKIDGKSFEYPQIFKNIEIKDNNIIFKLNKFYPNKDFNLLGINSKIIQNFKEHDTENILISKKEREKVILKNIREFKKDFNIFLFNYKTEIWLIFKEINFDIILYETDKNFQAMRGILEKNNYIYYENLFINKKFLIN